MLDKSSTVALLGRNSGMAAAFSRESDPTTDYRSSLFFLAERFDTVANQILSGRITKLIKGVLAETARLVTLLFYYFFNYPLFEIMTIEEEIDGLQAGSIYLNEIISSLQRRLAVFILEENLNEEIKNRCRKACSQLNDLALLLEDYFYLIDPKGIIAMKGDGNCLYHSIHTHLLLLEDYLSFHGFLEETEGRVPTAKELRLIAVKQMEKIYQTNITLGLLIDQAIEEADEDIRDREDYLKKAAQDSFWASPAEVYALSLYYKIPFFIKQDGVSPCLIGENNKDIPTTPTILHFINHFDIHIPN